MYKYIYMCTYVYLFDFDLQNFYFISNIPKEDT